MGDTKATALPQRSVTYVTRLTDTRIWNDFHLREGDVIISTPPKCGTTWMQALVVSLIFGRPGADIDLDEVSVWLDPGFRDQAPIVAMFKTQEHRRCIKTHTPLDGISYDPRCVYIAVYRHPIDAHFSMRRHQANMNFDLFDGRFPEDDPLKSFAYFLEDTDREQLADGITLSGLVHHYQLFRSWMHLPNIHMFHYADMLRDLPAHTSKVSEVLGYRYEPSLLQEIAESLTFKQMRANARSKSKHSAQRKTTFKDPAAFFHSASSRKWIGKLSEEEILAYRSKMSVLLTVEETRWLEEGSLPV